jgi:proliferating cell nuclear antigen
MKLMDIDTDTLGIPDTEYDCKVTMPSAEFARICRELAQLGESVRIEVNKEGIRFASEGEIANGSVLLKPTDAAHNRYEAERKTKSNGSSKKPKVKKEQDAEGDADMEEDDGGSIKEDNEEEEVEKPAKGSDDEEEASKEPEPESESEEESESKKRKRKATADKGKSPKKAKKAKKGDESDNDENTVSISVTQAVTLSFSLKYLINFSKSTGLCSHVELKLSSDVPLLVSQAYVEGLL